MIHAEVAVYPLKTTHASEVITNSIHVLKQEKIEYTVGSMDTHIHGDDEAVWSSLRKMFNEAQRSGEVSMVVTITNAAHH